MGVLALGAAVLLTTGHQAQARGKPANQAPPIDIRLHKLVFGQEKMPEQTPNDGKTSPFGKLGTPLAGATFSVYDVTADYWQQAPKDEQAMQKVSDKLAKAGAGQHQALTAVTTSADGSATFSQLPQVSGGKRAVYLFVETGVPEGAIAGQNLVVALPIKGQGAAKQLDLYPKNAATPTRIKKKVVANQTSFDAGATVPYQMTVTIPLDVASMATFKVADTADDNLTLIGDVAVTVAGKAIKGVTVTQTAHGFTAEFDTKVLAKLAGKTITMKYKMRLAANVPIDQPLVNTAVVYPGDQTPQFDYTPITTGGKHFTKVDLADQNVALQGAAFVVQRPDGSYLARDGKQQIWRRVQTRRGENPATTGLVVLTSNAAGHVDLTGLKAGKYRLIEVQSPKGYQRSTHPVDFTIGTGEYTDKDAAALKVVNAQGKTPGGEDFPPLPDTWGNTPHGGSSTSMPPKTPDDGGGWLPDTFTELFNWLPQTGNKRNWVLTLIGVALLLIGTVIYKRTKTQKGES